MDSAGIFSKNSKGCGDGVNCISYDMVRGVCPSGWHVPDVSEWKILFYFVGERDASAKLRASSEWAYYTKDEIGLDTYGFSALPFGYRDAEGTDYTGLYETRYWTRTEDSDGKASYFVFYSYYYEVKLNSGLKNFAYPIRCLKD